MGIAECLRFFGTMERSHFYLDFRGFVFESRETAYIGTAIWKEYSSYCIFIPFLVFRICGLYRGICIWSDSSFYQRIERAAALLVFEDYDRSLYLGSRTEDYCG